MDLVLGVMPMGVLSSFPARHLAMSRQSKLCDRRTVLASRDLVNYNTPVRVGPSLPASTTQPTDVADVNSNTLLRMCSGKQSVPSWETPCGGLGKSRSMIHR